VEVTLGELVVSIRREEAEVKVRIMDGRDLRADGRRRQRRQIIVVVLRNFIP
jgi:hypothetical protein